MLDRGAPLDRAMIRGAADYVVRRFPVRLMTWPSRTAADREWVGSKWACACGNAWAPTASRTHGEGQAVGFDLLDEIVHRRQPVGAGHVLHDDGRAARQVAAQKGSDSPSGHVGAAAVG